MFGKLKKFLQDSYNEMIHHVTWSKFDELQSSSILVLVASFIFAILIGAIDAIFRAGLDAFYNSF